MYWIEFNGIRNREYGIEVSSRPSIPSPEPRGDYVQVAGRDGSLLITDGTYNNIEIAVAMNFVRPSNSLGNAYRQAKSWLKGGGILKVSNDSDVFYKVKQAAIRENVLSRRGQKFTASFICDPYTYMDSGLKPLKAGQILNPFDESYPQYVITGSGDCTLTVNGHSITCSMVSNLTVDRDLMIAYDSDNVVKNTATTGDFLPLTLKPGINEVSITSGFDLSIIPNWRSL